MRLPWLALVLASAAFGGCDAASTASSVESPVVCDVTLTRERCIAACETASTRTFADERSAGEGCGGNAAQGCFYETATGNLWSSPSTTFGTVRFEGFRSCTAAETQQMRGGQPWDGGAVADADAATSRCTLTITRVHCAAECAEVATTRTFVEQRILNGCGGNGQSGCLYELATGDLWTSPTTTYMTNMFDEFRVCTDAEQAVAFGWPHADAGADAE